MRPSVLLVLLVAVAAVAAPRVRGQAAIYTPVVDSTSYADSTRSERLNWFADAKLGIFIHWGIYAVNGTDESWAFFNGYMSHDDYLAQRHGFTASKYDPAEWARMIAGSGARYSVLTTRHHDGVALWDSQAGGMTTVNDTPAKRDLVAPWVEAIRAEGLKVGLYYSHSDWSHPDYDVWTSQRRRYTDDPVRWGRFLAYHETQLRELTTRFRPDLYWFDGDWEHDAETWRFAGLRDSLFAWQPSVVLNSRIGPLGDYATPEQGVPIVRPDGAWELCMTVNDSWGWQPTDTNFKTPRRLLKIFADVIGNGGNLLLNISPRADGTFADEYAGILREFGRWTTKHAEAIYGTRAGLPDGHFWGPSTLSADGRTLYLMLPYRPSGPIVVKGLQNTVQRVRVVGTGVRMDWDVKMKPYWSEKPGMLYIDVPEESLDPEITVVAVLLNSPMEVYRER